MKKCILYSVAICLFAMNGIFAQSVTILPNNETIAGDLTFAANANRLISINNGTSSTLSLRSGSAAVSNFATPGGSLVLQAGNGYNIGFYPYTGGDVYIRSGGNLTSTNPSKSNGANIIFQTGKENNINNDQWAEQMRIDYNGNVGIGTASPVAKLDVNGDVYVNGKIINEAYIAPTLLNGWVNYDVPNGFATAAFYKDKENRVQLKGLLRSGTFTSGTVLFTLPVNYRPSQIMIYAVVNGIGFGRVDVYPNGDVKIVSGGNDYVSLDGITFRAMQ